MSAPTGADYRALSVDARALMSDIMNGDHHGAHDVVGTDAEQEAVDAGCIVTDGWHIWVAQEVAHLVTGPSRRETDLEAMTADRDRLAAEVKHLRAAVDPALRDRCQCCRRCGPSIPCDVVIETLGDSCAGACFCGAGS